MMFIGDLLDYLKDHELPISNVSELWSVFHHANKEAVTNMLKSGKIFYGTLSPGDLLYVPFGFVVSESTGSSDPVEPRWFSICQSGGRWPVAEVHFPNPCVGMQIVALIIKVQRQGARALGLVGRR